MLVANVVIGGIIAAAAIAVLWTLFFTNVVPWPGHALFTPLVFLIGGTIGAILGLERSLKERACPLPQSDGRGSTAPAIR